MLTSYAIGLSAIVAVAAAWAGVQLGWRRVFPPTSAERDVLAERIGCGGCGCTTVCQRESDTPVAKEEDSR